jgi:hypothetical protein
MTTAVAAPTMRAPSYVAPQTTAVAAPIAAGPSFVAPQFGMPAPVSLTQGLVAPQTLETERIAYEKALQGQLDKQSQAVVAESKIKQDMLRRTAEQQIAQFTLQTQEQCKIACLQVEREAQTTINGLREAAILQQTSTEERAAVQIEQYKKAKAMEEMAAKSYALQKQWFDGEAKLMNDYQKVMQAGSKAVATGMPMIPGGMMV